MAVSRLWEKTNYISDIPYINSNYVTEYDLSKANISSLLYVGKIDAYEYDRLYNMDKHLREIYIGNKLASKEFSYDDIRDGIKEAKRRLFESNNLTDLEILSIKNDAVFIIGTKPILTNFNDFIFSVKNVYTFFMNTSTKIEIYYKYDPMTGMEAIDVKGINDEVFIKHSNHMVQFLASVFYMIHKSTISDTLKYFNSFYEDYINRRLDIGYYREFNPESMFRIRSRYQDFGVDFISQNMINNIDIETNLRLLRDVHFVLTDLYFKTQK